jgi:hypothetical protein
LCLSVKRDLEETLEKEGSKFYFLKNLDQSV